MRRRALLIALILAISVVVGVAVWQKIRAPSLPAVHDPADLLVKDDEMVEVRSLADFGKAADRLLQLKIAGLGASLAGYGSTEEMARTVLQQLPFDPRRRDQVEKAGVDPDRPVAVGRPRGVGLTLVAPTRDPLQFVNEVARFAEERLGASERTAGAGLMGPRILFSRPGGSPLVGLEQAEGYGTVIVGKSLDERRPGTVLGAPAGYHAARNLADDASVFGYFPPGSQTASELHLDHGGAVAVKATAQAIELHAETVPAQDITANLGALAGEDGDDLLPLLDPDGFLFLGVGGSPVSLKVIWDAVMPDYVRRMTTLTGIDVNRDVFGNLKPGAVMSLSVAPTATLAQMPELDARRTNPFQYVRLTAIGRVVDPARAQAAVQRLAAAAPLFGAGVRSRDVNGVSVQTITYQLGEGVSFAMKGEYVLVTGGAGRMDASLGAIDKRTVSPSRLVKDLHVHGLTTRVDFSRLTEAVRALPASAYGVGGFAIRAAVNRWMDALAEIDRMDFGASLDQGTARGRLRLEFASAGSPASASAGSQPDAGPGSR